MITQTVPADLMCKSYKVELDLPISFSLFLMRNTKDRAVEMHGQFLPVSEVHIGKAVQMQLFFFLLLVEN